MPKRQNSKKNKGKKGKSRGQARRQTPSQPQISLDQISFEFIEECTDTRTMRKVVDLLQNEPFEELRIAATAKLLELTLASQPIEQLEDQPLGDFAERRDFARQLQELEKLRKELPKSNIPPPRNQQHSNGGSQPPSATTARTADRSQIQERVALSSKTKGNECFKAGDYAEAIDHYTRGIKIYQQHAPLFANRAACYLKLNNFPAASSDCTKALELDPTYVKAFCRRGEANMGSKKWKLAKKDFEAGLDLDSSNALMRRHLNTVMKKLSKKKKGFKVPIEAVDADSDMKAAEATTNETTKIQIENGSFSDDQDEDGDEKEVVETATDTNAPPPVTVIETKAPADAPKKSYPKAERWKSEGNALFKNSQYGEAIVVYQRAVDSMKDCKPDSNVPVEWYLLTCSCLNNQAFCSKQSSDFDNVIRKTTDAIQLLNQTTITSELRPTYWKALYRRAQAYDKAGNIEAALQDMECALNTWSNEQTQSALVRLRREYAEDVSVDANEAKDRGNALFKSKRYEHAIREYTTAIDKCHRADRRISLRGSLKDTMTNLILNRGLVRTKLNQMAEAIEDFSFVLKRINPNNVKALYRRASALEEVGRLLDAKLDWEKLLGLGEQIDMCNKNLATIEEQLAQTPQAAGPVVDSVIEEVTEEKEIPSRYRRAGETFFEFDKAWSRVKDEPTKVFQLCEFAQSNLSRLLKENLSRELLESVTRAIAHSGLSSQQKCTTSLVILESVCGATRFDLSLMMMKDKDDLGRIFDGLMQAVPDRSGEVEVLRTKFGI